MTRLLDRLTAGNSSGINFIRLWDRVCTKIESLFGQTFEALASMTDIADVHISADYTGAVNPAVYPVTAVTQRLNGSIDVTTSSTWSFSVDSGALVATISNGGLSITDITTTSIVTITSEYNGITKSRTFTVYKDIAAPPSNGVTDTSLDSFNSTTHAAVSDELVLTVGASGTVDLTAPLTIRTAGTTPTGTFKVWSIWRWWNGAAYVDLGTEVSSSPDLSVAFIPGPGYVISAGAITVPQSKTGLGVGSSQKFQLYARNNSGTRTMTFVGTARAATS